MAKRKMKLAALRTRHFKQEDITSIKFVKAELAFLIERVVGQSGEVSFNKALRVEGGF